MNDVRPSSVNRSATRWIAAASVLVALALSAAGTARSSRDVAPDSQLLAAYQPVLVFHPAERFRPTKIQSFVEDSVLERFVGTSPAQIPLDAYWTVVDADPEPGDLPAAAGVLYRLNQSGCDADASLAGLSCYADAWSAGSGGAAVYGRVARTSTRIVLQYWLFYYDNPFLLPTQLGTFWQSHEGDWELVNVVLDDEGAPVEAAYSQHCAGQRKAWASVEKSPGGSTHPVAYVALGSHANYFAPGPGAAGAIPLNPACVPSFVPAQLRPAIVDQVRDGSGVGAVVGAPGSGFEPATIHSIEGRTWSEFAGRWGESEYFFTPIAIGPVPASSAVPLGLAPASPQSQANWSPATVLGWPLA